MTRRCDCGRQLGARANRCGECMNAAISTALLPASPAPPPRILHRAAACIAEHAVNAGEARLLLDMLGLIGEEDDD